MRHVCATNCADYATNSPPLRAEFESTADQLRQRTGRFESSTRQLMPIPISLVACTPSPRTAIHPFAPAIDWPTSSQRHFLWLLLGCYALATLWPQPGLAMKQWEWSPGTLGRSAADALAAAVGGDAVHRRHVDRRPADSIRPPKSAAVGLSLVAVWLGPALLVVVAGWIVPWAVDGEATAGLLVGLALVAAMPVANSSVGWTQSAGGNLALGLALVVVSISLSPWVTPNCSVGLACRSPPPSGPTANSW